VGAYVEDTSRYGNILVYGKSNKIYGFTEKGNSGPGLINAGCYLIVVEDFKKIVLKIIFQLNLIIFLKQ